MDATEEGETHASRNDSQEFWNAIADVTGFVLPEYIRNILKFNGFDNAMSVKLMDEADIRAVENFAKSDGMLRILTSDVKDVNLKDYYGPFAESRRDFQILRGHRKVLMGISAFIREKGTQIVDENVKHIKKSGNEENIAFRSITGAGALDSKNDFEHDDSVKSNDCNLPVTETRTVFTPKLKTPLYVTDKMNRSSHEDVPRNGISFESTREREMAKITVRRNCFHLSHPYGPYGRGASKWC